MNCPHGEVSSFYYHRKLTVYNFTVHDFGTVGGSCYVWPEVVAQRGANEIASCLMNYIQLRAAHVSGRHFEFDFRAYYLGVRWNPVLTLTLSKDSHYSTVIIRPTSV